MPIKIDGRKKQFKNGDGQAKYLLTYTIIFCLINVCFTILNLQAQCPAYNEFYNNEISIENSNENNEIKLGKILELKQKFEQCGFEKDSLYARILHKTSVYQYSNGQLNNAIQNTLIAAQINTTGKKNTSRQFAINSYSNLGYYYHDLSLYTKSIAYFDSSILIGEFYPGYKYFNLNSRLLKCGIYYERGDYEKDASEATLALRSKVNTNDSLYIALLLLARAQAFEAEIKTEKAAQDISALLLWCNPKNFDLLASAYHIKGDVLADQGNLSEAVYYYKKTIALRIKAGNFLQTAKDYNDLGYLLRTRFNDLKAATKYFNLAYKAAAEVQDTNTCALVRDNLAQVSIDLKQYKDALVQSYQALQLLTPTYKIPNITNNPVYTQLYNTDKKNILDLLENKVKCLLLFYKQTSQAQLLTSAVSTALLADSVLTGLRYDQSDEKSKLYWRNKTREFFTNAIEACYLKSDVKNAFYFIEKSRAVLLNDKLNELGASIHLPAYEELKREKLLINIVECEKKLSGLNESSRDYKEVQLQLINANDNFDRYIKSLEQKYPAYYQYKYADEVPSLKDLQNYLAKNNQSFVHYFMGDTATYILAITSNNTRLVRLPQQEFNKKQLEDFLQLCANKEALNNHYNDFAVLSNSIYKSIFQKLQLLKGRLIICADNIVVPFDALCTDVEGKHYLLNDYSFSYVYSARFLMKPFNNPTASGNFIGFAPVSFAPYLKVQDLKNAADALQASAGYYKNDKLFVHQNASRNNFFKYASSYSVISIFSHARADTTDNEPVLFMQDSVIHLSELQLLNNPATRLVLLSACQTNVGKAATGEGIYSLARGFATAGIPSVSATLWKADEQTVYRISEKFNQYLSEGMNKDEALQKAKLYFIQNNSNEKLLPFFWANMILIGNTDAIKFTQSSALNLMWLFIAAVITLTLIFIYTRRKSLKQKRINNFFKTTSG